MNVPRKMVDVNRSVPTLLAHSFAAVTKDLHLMLMECPVMVSKIYCSIVNYNNDMICEILFRYR